MNNDEIIKWLTDKENQHWSKLPAYIDYYFSGHCADALDERFAKGYSAAVDDFRKLVENELS